MIDALSDGLMDSRKVNGLDLKATAFRVVQRGAQRRPAARKQATKRGLDPNKWFNHVEVLAAEKIGRETVQYVNNIFKYYLAYKMVIEEQGQREKAKEEMKKEMGK